MTDQRRNLVRAALDQHGHFTAEELYRRLGGSGEPVSMATVYRGLSLLEDADLVEGHDFADGHRRYERALDREHHDHMICADCRAVVEFTNDKIEKLQAKAAADHGFTLEDHSLTLWSSPARSSPLKLWRSTPCSTLRRPLPRSSSLKNARRRCRWVPSSGFWWRPNSGSSTRLSARASTTWCSNATGDVKSSKVK